MESESLPQGAEARSADAPPAKEKESWWGTLRFLLILFLAALLLRSFVVAPFSIPSGSMLPRLLIGDYLFVSKWSYGYSRYSVPFGLLGLDGRIFERLPARGDVVVFRYPGKADEDYVKRVIGLPGDTIALRGGVVILNGRPLPRQRLADFASRISPNSPCTARNAVRRLTAPDGTGYCAYPRFRETLPDGTSYEVLDQLTGAIGDDYGPIAVPEGHLFVMGDNRDDSLDSRFEADAGPNSGVGLLPVENLLGRVLIAFWSTDGSDEWLKPWTWFSAARWDRIGRTG